MKLKARYRILSNGTCFIVQIPSWWGWYTIKGVRGENLTFNSEHAANAYIESLEQRISPWKEVRVIY